MSALTRRLVVASLCAVSAVCLAPSATALPAPLDVPPAHQDELTVSVTGTDDTARDGTYSLDCHPAGGTHRRAADACSQLDRKTQWGSDPFAPVPPDANCTMIYGGPETARITGTWAGRPVDATFSRTNGCEMSRWDNLTPVLPSAGG